MKDVCVTRPGQGIPVGRIGRVWRIAVCPQGLDGTRLGRSTSAILRASFYKELKACLQRKVSGVVIFWGDR